MEATLLNLNTLGKSLALTPVMLQPTLELQVSFLDIFELFARTTFTFSKFSQISTVMVELTTASSPPVVTFCVPGMVARVTATTGKDFLPRMGYVA